MEESPPAAMTFLFTDIEGSTRRWEQDPEIMRVALARHDDVLRATVEDHAGLLFKHTGDGVCAVFSSANGAVAAAVAAQVRLELPVRMGLASGSAEVRAGDYFGPVLNRTARVMAAGHGGQILLGESTASQVEDVDLIDLGLHRLRDLSGTEHLFQVRAPGLQRDFPSLRTLEVLPGNLPVLTTSFVGRRAEVKRVMELVGSHRLVTLTGVGGVGKTRLALQVAAELVGDYPEGVWLVELAPVSDAAAVPEVAAAALGVIPQSGMSVAGGVVEALSGRRVLIVMDNCEHVLDAAAELVQTILAGTTLVSVIATSREGLRIGAEHLWPVPAFQVGDEGSEAVELFVERAIEVDPEFRLGEQSDRETVSLICQRLDGIALAIELAAARMVSMSPHEVLDRLDDRFRLLGGGRRGSERHQTLRHAVEWSFDLLDEREKSVLARCSVFAGGFDVRAAAHLCGTDEYSALDVLDSLVRKSLVTVQRVARRTRYGLLETIRHYASEQLATTDVTGTFLAMHADYFAGEIVRHWELWFGPDQVLALDWVEVELANLRAGFRWAADHGDLGTAIAIAAHTPILTFLLQLYEPVGWAEELLPVAAAADDPQLPRLYSAASFSVFAGKRREGVQYAETALVLDNENQYDGFGGGVSEACAVTANLFADPKRALELCGLMAAQDGWARSCGLAQYMWVLPLAGKSAEARGMAEEALRVARAHGQPMCIALTLGGCGRAFGLTDPDRALAAFREGLSVSKQHHLRFLEFGISRETATFETLHGDATVGLHLFDAVLDGFQRAGNQGSLNLTLGSLTTVFDHLEQPDLAATIYGAATRSEASLAVPDLAEAIEHLRSVLGSAAYDRCVATGSSMELIDAVAYARQEMRLLRELAHNDGSDNIEPS